MNTLNSVSNKSGAIHPCFLLIERKALLKAGKQGVLDRYMIS
jgi:hypothetical protein